MSEKNWGVICTSFSLRIEDDRRCLGRHLCPRCLHFRLSSVQPIPHGTLRCFLSLRRTRLGIAWAFSTLFCGRRSTSARFCCRCTSRSANGSSTTT
jgi:hypothetical protein